jgi:hypothetical protein
LIQREDLVALEVLESLYGHIVKETTLRISGHGHPFDPGHIGLNCFHELLANGPNDLPTLVVIVAGYGQGYEDITQASALDNTQTFGFTH